MNIAGQGFGVKEDQVFFKRLCLGNNLSVRAKRHAGTVKNQAVIAANLIHQHHGNLVIAGDGLQHLPAQLPLAQMIGRSGNIQHKIAARVQQIVHRINTVKPAMPEMFVIPGIFANGKRNLLSASGNTFCDARDQNT